MSYNVATLQKLIDQFQKMPSVGAKSAQRMAFYVLGLSEDEAKEFASSILEAHEKIHKCSVCCNLTEKELCNVCDNPARDRSVICVVEDPRDVIAIEKTHEFKGTYHVLHGAISPMNGVGPEQLTIKELLSRMNSDEVQEVIMATNPTVEGEATAMYISRLLKPMGVKVTRLAYGVPVGADLEYADEITLLRALEGRQVI
ncbi:MAG: recombination protein RecR [Ruminococcaceae bacterium]|jgi:recombination protein RecR|nr:recombination protein RecR [Oscillospiraceae bacterium]